MNYVYSTASCSTEYAIFKVTNNREISQIEHKILIKGGANVATKFPNLYTPKGVVTQVSDEDLALLEQDYHFKQHVELGFLTVDKRRDEIDAIVANMRAKDRSAPRTPSDPEFDNIKATSSTSEETTTKGLSYAGTKKGKK